MGYRSTSVLRSPSPAPPPRKMPVKIIRPPKEPVASTSKIEQPAMKVTSQTISRRKANAQKSAPPGPPPSPPKQSTPVQPSLPLPTVISSPPPPPMSFVPSDLYISMMSGLAMANISQTMQVAAAADPITAFQLAQICFAPTSAFPLPPFSLVSPQTDRVVVQQQLHTPKLPPKPVSNSTTKSNPKLIPALPPVPSLAFREDSQKLASIPTPISTSDTSSATIEMDSLILRQKRQARKNKIGWIPEPVLPYRGTFNLVPTHNYVHWSASGEATQPDPQRSLVMEDLPVNCRTTEFVRSWSDQFSAIAVYLNGDGKALIEFPSREIAEEAYDSPRLRDGLYKRAMHVRVFWYRPQVKDTASAPTPTTSGNTDATGEVKDDLNDIILANLSSELGEPVSMDIDDPSPLAESAEIQRTAQPRGKGKELSLPPPERDPLYVSLPVRSSTAPTSTSPPGSPFTTISSNNADQEQRRRSTPVDFFTNGSRGGTEHTTTVPPSPSVSLTSCTKALSPRLRSPSLGAIQRKRTPAGSPPSLRYPSSTPETANHPGRVPSPSEGTSAYDIPSPTSTSEPRMTGDSSLEQQLRTRLLVMKQTRIMSRSGGRSSSTSTPSTAVDPEPDTLFKVASSPPTPQALDIVTPESLELLANSFIADTLQAARRLPSEPDIFDTAIKARLNKKRGSHDAFGSSADIAFKRQRLSRQIEESKRIMERFKAAKTKEERSRIYALWEESNRFVSSNRVDCVLTLFRDPLFLAIFRSVELLSKPAAVPFQWPCHAARCLVIESDDEEEPMELS